ncbi:hypothetical protein MTO96_027835 [Rhipicephalus appendiculatus]
MHLIQQASRVGRLDAFVQSTDKNFLVPVGGGVVAGFDRALVDAIAQMYPGRASAAPTMDVFITLLSLGMSGFLRLRDERRAMFKYLQESLRQSGRETRPEDSQDSQQPDLHGHDYRTEPKKVGDWTFRNWGSHSDSYPSSYLTAASALGLQKEEVDVFVRKLDKVLTKAYGGPKGESNCPEV